MGDSLERKIMKALWRKFLISFRFGRWIFNNLFTVPMRSKVLFAELNFNLQTQAGLSKEELQTLMYARDIMESESK